MQTGFAKSDAPHGHPRNARETGILRHLTNGLVLLIVSLASTQGCGHGKVHDGLYLAPKERYQISFPGDPWKRISGKGLDFVLTCEEKGASVLASSLCGRYEEAGLDVLSRNLFLGMEDRRVLESRSVTLPAGEAQRLQVRARVNGTVFRSEAYTLKRSSCIYDFVYISLPEEFEANLQVFRDMMDSLRFANETSR